MSSTSWKFVFLAGFICYVVIHGIFERRTKSNTKNVVRSDWKERLLLFVMFVGTFLLPLLYVFTHVLAFADYTLPRIMPWIGVTVMVAALWLFWRSHSDLGVNWSRTLDTRLGHELVTHGVYQHVRHPMYVAIWLFALGQGLLLANWLAGWSGLVAFAAMYAIRVPREEAMMREVFGDQYRDYMQRTGRLFPRLTTRK